MTLEALKKRKKELQDQQQQAIATTNAIAGAIQDCDFWIAQLELAAVPPAVDPALSQA
jgi:hypothetical protein